MNTFRTVEHLANCATRAAIEARQDPLLLGLTYRLETRPVDYFASSARWKTGSRSASPSWRARPDGSAASGSSRACVICFMELEHWRAYIGRVRRRASHPPCATRICESRCPGA